MSPGSTCSPVASMVRAAAGRSSRTRISRTRPRWITRWPRRLAAGLTIVPFLTIRSTAIRASLTRVRSRTKTRPHAFGEEPHGARHDLVRHPGEVHPEDHRRSAGQRRAPVHLVSAARWIAEDEAVLRKPLESLRHVVARRQRAVLPPGHVRLVLLLHVRARELDRAGGGVRDEQLAAHRQLRGKRLAGAREGRAVDAGLPDD